MNKIYVIGIGPGAYEKMTIEAAEALRECDVIVGYTVYVDPVSYTHLVTNPGSTGNRPVSPR